MLPTNTQISLHIRAVWSVFVICMKKICILCYPKCDQWRFWSDCAFAQSDLNLHWSHMSEGTFSDVAVHILTHSRAVEQTDLVISVHKTPYHMDGLKWQACEFWLLPGRSALFAWLLQPHRCILPLFFFLFSHFRCLDKAVLGDRGLSCVKGPLSLDEVPRHVRVSVFKF